MKKLYILLFTLLITAFSFGQSLIITRIIDGKAPSDGCSGSSGASSPKAVEIYVDGTIDFTGYKYEIESNGTSAGVASWNSTDISSLGSRTNEFVYICPLGTTTLYEMYSGASAANTHAGGTQYNGNDAIRITDGANVLDQYGDPLDVEAGDYSAWDNVDSYAKRNDGSTANAGAFNESNWTIPGGDYFDTNGISSCADMLAEVDFGGYLLSTKDNQIEGFRFSPNPTALGYVNISSRSQTALQINVFDILGKQVISNTITNNKLDVSYLNAGIYIMRVSQNNVTTTKKLVIQ